MNEKNFGYLGSSFQQGLLKAIIEDKKFAVTIIDVIDSKYFDGPYFRYLTENIKELYNEYKTIPTYGTLRYKIMAENPNSSGKVHLDTLDEIEKLQLEDSRYIKSVSLKFCRQQVIKKALKNADNIIQNGLFEEYDKIENLITEALQVGARTDDISDISENIRESLQEDARVTFPTGISGIDILLKGGLARGELGIILSPTGIGKTTILTKFANAAYNYGANVLHVFFEDKLDTIRKKHYVIWTGISPDDQQQQEDEVVRIVTDVTSNRQNRLFLLKLPAFGVSVSDIKNKIRKLESEGRKVDIIIIDYVDCISTERTLEGEEWKGEGTIMRTLEGMADEFNVAMWTATQGNRESISSEVVTTDQMGGSIKKAQVGHVVISVAKSLQQKENNLANITLLKSRIGKDGVIFSNCKFDNEYLLFDTDTQNTLLGHEEERSEAKKQHAANVYRETMERKLKIKKEVEDSAGRLKLESALSNILNEKTENLNLLHNFEEEQSTFQEPPKLEPFDLEISPDENNVLVDVIVEPIVDVKTQLNDEEIRRKRAAEVYKMNKKIEQ